MSGVCYVRCFFNCIKKRENKNNSLKTFSKHENISEKETAIIRIKMKRSTEQTAGLRFKELFIINYQFTKGRELEMEKRIRLVEVMKPFFIL